MEVELQGQQPDKPRKQKRRLKQHQVMRLIISVVALILFVVGTIIAILSSHGSLFNIVSIGFAVLGLIIALFQWLFPLSSAPSESSKITSLTLSPDNVVNVPPTQAPTSQSSTIGKATYRGIVGLPPPIDPRTIQQREKVVEDVYNKLIQPGITAIALTGIGGVGKSTLAALIYHYAEEQRRIGSEPSFDEPTWLTINDSVTMADLIGSLFEILNKPLPDLSYLTPQSQAVALFKALNTVEKPRLLILDQFENLLDWQTGYALEDRPGVGEWLDAINGQQCRSRILMTSRPWPKGTREYPPTYMQEYHVKGLELTEGSDLLRKQGVKAGETELGTAVERCQGHAFSLTLLASLLHNYNLDLSILFKDQNYAQIWTGNIAHNLLDRIYTHKLDAMQHKLLMAFSVYREPVPLEAALVAIDSSRQVLSRQYLPALQTLLAQHLLQATGGGHYQLHTIVSSYAQDQFIENDEQANQQSLQAAHGKAAQYYLSQARIQCPSREKRQQTTDVQPLIEAIWQLCQAGQWEQAYELMQQEHIFDDFIRWGGHATLLEIYQLMLSSETWQMERSQVASIYNNLGEIYMVLGRVKRAIEYYKQALPIYQEIKDRAREGWMLNNIGVAYNPLGDKEQAQYYLEQAVKVFREVGDHGGEGTALRNLGWAYYDRGQIKKALGYFEEALKAQEEAGDHKEGRTLYSIGRVYADLKALEEARNYYDRALAVLRVAGDHAGEGIVLSSLGRLYRLPDQKELALRYSEQALSILKKVGDRSPEGWAFKCLGRVYYDLGELEQAQRCYEQAWVILREVEDHRGEGRALNNLGLVSDVQGQKDQALKYYTESLRILRGVGDRWGEGKTMWNISTFYSRQRRYDVALACSLLAKNIFDEIQAPDLDKVESYAGRLSEEIGEERFVALLAKIEPQAPQIVEQALGEKITEL